MKHLKSIGKSVMNTLTLFYGGIGAIILLVIMIIFPPVAILIIGVFAIYLYNCIKKKR